MINFRLIFNKMWFLSAVTIILTVGAWFNGPLTACIVFLLGLSGMLYGAQDLLLYYPNDPPDSRLFVLQPSNYKLPYESIKIKTKDGYKIHMFLLKQTKNSNVVPTMIFFHGNAGNMGQRLCNVYGFYHKLNINILLVEYRGYGLSEGSPSENGLYIDAQSALDYLLQRTDIDNTKIILFGRSLGGAVAIDLASRIEYRNKVWALIVENTFTSIPDMAKVLLKWRVLKYLPKIFYKNQYMSLSKISQVVMPTLIICGLNDLLVPPYMTKELYASSASSRKQIVVIPGVGHDDTWTFRDYNSIIQKFISEIPPLAAYVERFVDNQPQCSIDPIVHTV